jgi:hypothetical protein
MPDSRRKSKPDTRAGAAGPDARLTQTCAELNIQLDQVLAWRIHPERIVILLKTGQKLSRTLQP